MSDSGGGGGCSPAVDEGGGVIHGGSLLGTAGPAAAHTLLSAGTETQQMSRLKFSIK